MTQTKVKRTIIKVPKPSGSHWISAWDPLGIFFSKTFWRLKLSLWMYPFSYYENTLDNILYFSWERFQFSLVFRNIIFITLTNSSDTLLSSLLSGAYGKEYLHALRLPTYKPTRCTHSLHLQRGRRMTVIFFFAGRGLEKNQHLHLWVTSVFLWHWMLWSCMKIAVSFIYQVVHCIQM